MIRSLPLLAGVAGLMIAGTASAAGKPLFAPGNGQADARNDRVLERLLNNPSTRDLKLVGIDASASDSSQIELDVGGRRVTVDRQRSERTAGGSDVWYGRVQHSRQSGYAPRETAADPLNDVVLVRRGNQITGSVRVDGQLFRIRPLPSGATAVIEVDENRMPADHPEAAYRAIFEAAARDKTAVSAKGKPCRTNCGGGGTPIDPGPTQTIRVMVVATNDAIAAYGGDMQALVELAVAESNQGYVNSNIGINMVLANYSTTTYATAGMSTDLSRFRGTSDGYMDTIHATRDANAADVGMLVANDASACGLASGIGSTASTAFATAYWDCITGYYSFAHEIGHLQSARHDPATDSSTSPYAYGHGYREPGNAWRTVMAYNCTGAGCPRINYWSNPSVTYGGVPMGTYDKSHNQRVLVETKATVAGFR
ncbi:M12 family metallo-peptidase [Lysobacter niabensis]|uniref:M12 family metallo-peptidase n=1 Tax=Agrilutibacter niabensis TaxID=380628 RepID=UPI0036073F67